MEEMYYHAVMDLSQVAKNRIGKTKKERIEKMRQIALTKSKQMTKKEKQAQSKLMLAGRYKKA